jgi:hypothetical protein
MKSCLAMSAGIALLSLLSSCAEHSIVGRGDDKTESRQLPPGAFSRIEIDGPVDAHISIGEAPSLTFKGYANVLPYLRSEVRGNTLRIFTDEHTDLQLRKNITAAITLPSLRALDLSGAAHVLVAGDLHTSDFELDLSGASSVDIESMHVATLDADLSGAATLAMLSGSIDAGGYDISGAGKINAFGVMHRRAAFDMSGAAKAEVTVGEKLDAEISGAGTVRYKGHPAISKDVSGAGSVVDAN